MEVGVEAFNHPRETFDSFVHYMGSAEGWPMHDNFASVGASGGVEYISSGATMVRANTTLVVVHQPAVTCRSTPEIPCWIVLEAPEGYTLFSGGAPATLPCSLWPLSSTTCDAWARSCTFVVTPGETLWANVQY